MLQDVEYAISNIFQPQPSALCLKLTCPAFAIVYSMHYD